MWKNHKEKWIYAVIIIIVAWCIFIVMISGIFNMNLLTTNISRTRRSNNGGIDDGGDGCGGGGDSITSDGSKRYNLRGGVGCTIRSSDGGIRRRLLMLLVDSCNDYSDDDADDYDEENDSNSNESKVGNDDDPVDDDEFNKLPNVHTTSPTLSPGATSSSWTTNRNSGRSLIEPNYYPPTFNVIDVSYNGLTSITTATPENNEANNKEVIEKNNYIDNDDGSPTVTSTTSSSSSSSTTKTVEVNTTAMTALPAIVIGFASTIVFCGLFLFMSEFRERRRFNKSMAASMIQMSSDISGSGDDSGDHSSSQKKHLKLVAWDGKQFRVISNTDSNGGCQGDESTSRRIGIHRRIQSPHHNNNNNNNEESGIFLTNTAAAARIYDNNSSSNESSLYYDDSYPSDEERQEEDNDLHQCHPSPRHCRHRCRDDYFSSHNHQIYITDENSISFSAVSTMTTSSVRFNNSNIINAPIYDNNNDDFDDNDENKNDHHRRNSETITELSDIHRVSDDTKIKSLVNLGTIPATTKFVASASVVLEDSKVVIMSSNKESTKMMIHENKEQHTSAISLQHHVSNSDPNDNSKRHTLSSFDAGVTSTSTTTGVATGITSITSPIPEIMIDTDVEDEDDNDDEKINSHNNCSFSEEGNEPGWSNTIGKSHTYSDNSDDENQKVIIGKTSHQSRRCCSSSIDTIQSIAAESTTTKNNNYNKSSLSSSSSSSILSGEDSLIAIEKNNGYTVLETEYKILEEKWQKVMSRSSAATTTMATMTTSSKEEEDEGREDVVVVDADSSLALLSYDRSEMTTTTSTDEYRTHPDYSSDNDNDDNDYESVFAPPSLLTTTTATNPSMTVIDKCNNADDDSNNDIILVDNSGFHHHHQESLPKKKIMVDNNNDDADDDTITHESSTSHTSTTESNYSYDLVSPTKSITTTSSLVENITQVVREDIILVSSS